MSGHVDLWQPHTCECCLATTEGFYKDIAAEYYWMGRKEVYEDMLLFVFNITIDTGQQEHRICEMCIQKLRNSFNFKRQVLESQKKLLVKSVDAESLSFKETSSLDIKLDVSTWQDDSTDANSEPLCVGRATSLDIKLEDSPICQDDSNIELSVTLEEDNNISSLSIENVIPDAVENAKRRTLKRLRGSPSENSSLLTGNTADTSPQGLCDTFGNDNNSSSLKISNEIPDAVNKAKRRKRRRPIKTQKQPPSEDSYLHTESVEDISPQGKQQMSSSSELKREAALSKLRVKAETVQIKEELEDPESASRVKESLMKDTTLKLVLNSNLTLFDWFKNKYRCFFCKEMFFDTMPLKEHATTHNDKEITEKLLRFNVKYFYRAEISDLKCLNCEKLFDAVESLTQHLISIHSISIATEDSLLMPFRLKESACLICKQEYKSFLLLDHHMSSHYNKYICDTCGKGFRQKSSLKSHKNTHLKRNFDCKLCRTSFDSYYKKRKHDLVEHKVEYNNVCPHCPEKFKHYIARMWHLIRNHGYKKPEFSCLHCGKTYITNALLRSHTRKVHMQERNHECSICSNKYMRKCELNDHMKSHIQARDFVCSYCGKGFFRKRNLNEHLAIHVEEYRHVCTVCGKTFAQKYNMNMHRKRCQEIKKKQL